MDGTPARKSRRGGTRYLDASDWPRPDYIEGVWWNPAKAGAGVGRETGLWACANCMRDTAKDQFSAIFERRHTINVVEKLEFAVLPKLRRGRVRCGNAAQIAMLEARQDVRMRYKDFLVVLHIGAGFAPYEG